MTEISKFEPRVDEADWVVIEDDKTENDKLSYTETDDSDSGVDEVYTPPNTSSADASSPFAVSPVLAPALPPTLPAEPIVEESAKSLSEECASLLNENCENVDMDAENRFWKHTSLLAIILSILALSYTFSPAPNRTLQRMDARPQSLKTPNLPVNIRSTVIQKKQQPHHALTSPTVFRTSKVQKTNAHVSFSSFDLTVMPSKSVLNVSPSEETRPVKVGRFAQTSPSAALRMHNDKIDKHSETTDLIERNYETSLNLVFDLVPILEGVIVPENVTNSVFLSDFPTHGALVRYIDILWANLQIYFSMAGKVLGIVRDDVLEEMMFIQDLLRNGLLQKKVLTFLKTHAHFDEVGSVLLKLKSVVKFEAKIIHTQIEGKAIELGNQFRKMVELGSNHQMKLENMTPMLDPKFRVLLQMIRWFMVPSKGERSQQ
ncbi:hypothetical protein HK098_003238 [Nowakowskiella sp. JEL0407]|nr:hypothetical protein HK098_003238 [Nowakowskiella sp. JEL0407]